MKNVTIVDVHENGYTVEDVPLSSGVSTSLRTALLLPRALPDISHRSKRLTSVKSLAEIVYARNRDALIIGRSSDPFADAEAHLPRTLSFLKHLQCPPCALVCIQTRSPNVLLALPALRALGEQVVVTVALEGLDLALWQKTSHACASPGERIRTARALKRLGITTTVQWAPMIEEGAEEERVIRDSAQLLISASNAVRVVPFDLLFSRIKPERRVFAGGLARDADVRAAQYLRLYAPDSFLGHAAPGFHAAAA